MRNAFQRSASPAGDRQGHAREAESLWATKYHMHSNRLASQDPASSYEPPRSFRLLIFIKIILSITVSILKHISSDPPLNHKPQHPSQRTNQSLRSRQRQTNLRQIQKQHQRRPARRNLLHPAIIQILICIPKKLLAEPRVPRARQDLYLHISVVVGSARKVSRCVALMCTGLGLSEAEQR